MGIKHLSEFLPEFREYAGVPLLSPLKSSGRYRVVFYVSFADSAWSAGRNVGIHFSFGMPTGSVEYMLTLEADVKYEGEDFLTNKEGWTRIEGVYLAQGGENFLSIGNFDNDAESETIFVEGGGVLKPWSPDAWKVAYYFIDDISVIDVDSLVGVEASLPPKGSMSIYPNPVTEHFIIEHAQSGETLELYDIAGKRVFSMVLHSSKQTIATGDMPAGVYVAALERDGAIVERKKLIIQ